MDERQVRYVATRTSHSVKAVDQVFTNSDLVYLILAACDAAAMLQLGGVNRTMHSILQLYMQTAFSIDHLLSRFFPDPDMFRILQRKTATLIGGSQALHFFDRSSDSDSGLDLFLFPGRERDIADFLMGLGYIFMPHKSQLSPQSFAEEDARAYSVDPRPKLYPNDWIREDVFTLECLDSLAANYLCESDNADDFERLGITPGVHRSYSFVKETDEGQSLRVSLVVTSSSPIETILNTSTLCAFLILFFLYLLQKS